MHDLVLRPLVASVTTAAFLATGCAGDRPWPSHPVALANHAFATQGEIATIDVLPLDLQIWADQAYDANAADLRAGAEVNLMNASLETLTKRNYTLAQLIDWNGNYPGGSALSKDDLLATVGSLAHYGATTAQHPGELPAPFLPARLGTSTGADATLYVGGWAYVAKPHESTGDQIAQGILIGLLVVTVVALIIAVADHKSDHGHGHGHDHGHGHGGGGRVSSGGGTVSASHAFTAAHSWGRARGGRSSASSASGVGAAIDAFGRTAIDLAVSVPDWSEDPALPPDTAESQMYLEMTLVDNHTGLALWHAHQTFPASAASASETARVARTMLSTLPERASTTAAR